MKMITKVMLLLLAATTHIVVAQTPAPWTLNGNSNAGSGNRLGTTNNFPLNIITNNTQKAVILPNGNFGLGTTSPVSLFHIDGSSNTGEVFSTTSSTNVVSAWRMLKGAGATAEKFVLYVPSGSNNAILQTSQNNGDLLFNTGGAITRMVIKDGGIGPGAGYVGIGNGLPQPTSRLHLHNNTAPTTSTQQVNYLQVTIDAGNGTGSGGNDGFKLGVRSRWNSATSTYQSDAELRQQENAPMNFFTANAQRVTINNMGFVGVGDNFLTPRSRFHIDEQTNGTPVYSQWTNFATTNASPCSA